MKTKIIAVCIFALFIIGLCTFEITSLSGTVADISESSKKIINQIENYSNKDMLLENLNATYSKWQKQEGKLCLIFNHKDLLEVGKEINQAISYIEIDENQEAYVHMQLLQEDLRALENIINFDFLNIF